MNLLPLLIGLMLMNGFKKDKNKKQGGLGSLGDLGGIFSNPDAMALIPHITKLFDNGASEEDKNAAMMALMTNPAVFELVQKFMTKKTDGQATEQNDGQPDDAPKGDGGKSVFETGNGMDGDAAFDAEAFSAESKEFFKPVENVAGVEISQKLYGLYDNWYIKK